MPIKTGLLGGAFNPPHIAHLLLAERAVELFRLDRLIFIPTRTPPHKKIDGNWDGPFRSLLTKIAVFCITPSDLEMELSFRYPDNPNNIPFVDRYKILYHKNHNSTFSVSDYEIQKESTSYTIDTVRHLLAENPEQTIHIIIGMDQAAVLNTWKEWRELSRIALFCAANRGDYESSFVAKKYPFIQIFPFPKMAVSSTMIRELLRKDGSTKNLLPPVLELFMKLFKSCLKSNL